MIRAATPIFASQIRRASPGIASTRRPHASIAAVPDVPAETVPIWTPPAAPSHPLEPLATGAHDATLLAILDAPLDPRETIASGFARKEPELRAAVAAVPLSEVRTLQRRFSIAARGDVLVERFGRLTADRRIRFIAFLADAPRRAAIAAAKGAR